MSDILVIEPNDDDEYAEEAELDGVEEVEEEQSKNWLMGIAAGLIVSLVLIGETVGGLIGLNNYENIEFGVGTATLTNCDSELTVRPIAGTEASGDELGFKLSAVEISGISDECLNKTFTLSLYSSNIGTPANFVQIGDASSPTSANYVRFTLATQRIPDPFAPLDTDNPAWLVYPKFKSSNPSIQQLFSSELPEPLSDTGLESCLPAFTGIEDIDFDSDDLSWTAPEYASAERECGPNEYLKKIVGYIEFPGTDNGTLFTTNFSLRSTGNAILKIGNRTVISDTSSHSVMDKTGSFVHRRGSTYFFELWYYKGIGSAELRLRWNRNDCKPDTTSGGFCVVPSSALTESNQVGYVIPTSEGAVNYTVTEVSNEENSRAVRINLGTPRISSAEVSRFTLKTSD